MNDLSDKTLKGTMKKIDKLIEENIAKYVKTLSPKTIHFVGGVTQDFGETTF